MGKEVFGEQSDKYITREQQTTIARTIKTWTARGERENDG
jgi:hypothetical protein